VASAFRLRAATSPALARFARAKEGVALVEFALVLPVMIIFYFGLVGLTIGIMQDRKVTMVGRTVADLTGRMQGVMNNQEVNNIVAAAGSVLAPHDPNGTEVILASVAVLVTGRTPQGQDILTTRICWSAGRIIRKSGNDYVVDTMSNLGEWARGNPYPDPLPAGFANGNTSFVVSSVKQEYKPVIGAQLMRLVTKPSRESIPLEEQMPWPVRPPVREIPWEGQAPCLPA